VKVFADLDAIAHAAADDFASLVAAKQGTFHVALSGGSTPKRLFDVLATRKDIAWDRVELWWGDERTVPPDHPDSNFGMTKKHLIDPLRPLGLTRVHRMADADDYERELVAALGAPPVFDLVWLGMGKDGHTASLFPGSPALNEQERYVVLNHVDSPLTNGKTTRITLTYPALAAARHTRFLVAGADKADALARTDNPAHRVTGADVQWFVDVAAAGRHS
jgi:6-phosphogluconolactonase